MTLKIRLISDDPKLLDTAETAIRTVMDVPAETFTRRGRHRPAADAPVTRLRYLEATGVRDEWGLPPAPLARAEEAKRNRDLVGEIAELVGADEALTRQSWYPIQPGDVVLCHIAAMGGFPAYGTTYLAVDDPMQTDVAGNAGLRDISRTQLGEDTAAGADEPKYLLFYDATAGHWCVWTNEGAGLQPWVVVSKTIAAANVELAQRWVEREINSIEGGSVAGWSRQEDSDGYVPTVTDPPDPDAGREWLTPFYDLWFEAGPAGLVVIRAGAIVHGNPARMAGDQ